MPDFYRVEMDDLKKALKDLSEKDAPFLLAYTLTTTAKNIQAAERDSMASVFDRPTTFTLNSLAVRPATKTDPNAIVYYREGNNSVPAYRYLGPEVDGGVRKHKSFELRLIRVGLMKANEFAVPGKGIALDQYGNIKGSLIERILSQVGAAEIYAGYKANATKRSLKRAKARGTGRYFVLRPDLTGNLARAVPPGIYHREGLRDIVPVILFVRAPDYRKRFPFHEVAQKTYDARLLLNARAGFQKYVVEKARA